MINEKIDNGSLNEHHNVSGQDKYGKSNIQIVEIHIYREMTR